MLIIVKKYISFEVGINIRCHNALLPNLCMLSCIGERCKILSANFILNIATNTSAAFILNIATNKAASTASSLQLNGNTHISHQYSV